VVLRGTPSLGMESRVDQICSIFKSSIQKIPGFIMFNSNLIEVIFSGMVMDLRRSAFHFFPAGLYRIGPGLKEILLLSCFSSFGFFFGNPSPEIVSWECAHGAR